MNKIIVVSKHSRDVFVNTEYTGTNEQTGESFELKTITDVNYVNYPVKTFEELPALDLELEYDTNFLCVAQWGPRKNMHNLVRWFVEEFRDEEVGLVLKTSLAKNSLIDREMCDGSIKKILYSIENRDDIKCKVYLLHGDMTDEEMHSLYSHDKVSAFVSIPHGEGYGLPLFEAAYSGLPVVAPGWSGQLDFLVDENGKDKFYNVSYDLNNIQKECVWDGVLTAESMWCYPREESFKTKIRACLDDLKSNSGIAASSVEYSDSLRTRFSEEELYSQFVESLGLEIDSEWAESISQIEIL